MASRLARIARDASAARDAARIAAAAAARAARLAAATASGPEAAAAASRASRSAAAVASRASRSAAIAASRAARSDILKYSATSRVVTEYIGSSTSEDECPLPDYYIAGMDVTDKDIESDEALWALYGHWCKVFNKVRDQSEMARRFPIFKKSALFIHRASGTNRKLLGMCADGIEMQDENGVQVLDLYQLLDRKYS